MADEVDNDVEVDNELDDTTPQGFISFSGDRSKNVAKILRDHLDDLLSEVELFVSEQDIASGAQWRGEIDEELNNAEFGILCVTPENKSEEWLLFEAGALSRQDKRVVPYLLGLQKTDLTGPLADIQAVEANKEDTWEMIQELRASFEPDSEKRDGLVEKGFERSWPLMDEAFADLRGGGPAGAQDDGRSQEEMIRETLEHVRELRHERLEISKNREDKGWKNATSGLMLMWLAQHFEAGDVNALRDANMRYLEYVLKKKEEGGDLALSMHGVGVVAKQIQMVESGEVKSCEDAFKASVPDRLESLWDVVLQANRG